MSFYILQIKSFEFITLKRKLIFVERLTLTELLHCLKIKILNLCGRKAIYENFQTNIVLIFKLISLIPE